MSDIRVHREGGIDEVARGVTSDADAERALLTYAARRRLADGRDDAADERDDVADQRDRVADARDAHAGIRDDAVSDQPDPAGTRRFAAQDRAASAENRVASADDRQEARDGRLASRGDRSVAEQIKAQFLLALDDADNLPEAALQIGRAQGMLVDTYGGTASEALIEIADRAHRDDSGMEEAARQVMSDGAPSSINGIREPVL